MGLGFRHPGSSFETSPHWAYSGFDNFRRRLMRAWFGIELDSMVGFGGETEWTPYAKSPLYPLLNHSDCDGELTAAECALVGPALRAAIPLIGDAYDQHHAGRLADAMDACAIHNAPLEFC